MKFILFLVFFILISPNHSFSGIWCKAVYPYTESHEDGEFQKQLSLCKNSDNLFVSIHSKYKNAKNLLLASIANFCDLNKQVVINEKKGQDSYYSAVCSFRRHYLRDK